MMRAVRPELVKTMSSAAWSLSAARTALLASAST